MDALLHGGSYVFGFGFVAVLAFGAAFLAPFVLELAFELSGDFASNRALVDGLAAPGS